MPQLAAYRGPIARVLSRCFCSEFCWRYHLSLASNHLAWTDNGDLVRGLDFGEAASLRMYNLRKREGLSRPLL